MSAQAHHGERERASAAERVGRFLAVLLAVSLIEIPIVLATGMSNTAAALLGFGSGFASVWVFYRWITGAAL